MPLKDPEAKRAYERQYYNANRETQNAYRKAWKAKNKDKVWSYVRKINGYPLPTRPEAEWCECCGRLLESAPCLDHCHLTGVFRGWLCSQCNCGIGLLGDDIAGLNKAIAYLKKVYGNA
jgi:hypothetical protein